MEKISFKEFCEKKKGDTVGIVSNGGNTLHIGKTKKINVRYVGIEPVVVPWFMECTIVCDGEDVDWAIDSGVLNDIREGILFFA